MTSETLEEGFLSSKLSQTENPCNKIPENMDSVSLCNLCHKCTTDVVNNGHHRVNDVKIGAKLGQESIKESTLCDGIVENNESNKFCFPNNYPDEKIVSVLANVDVTNNNDMRNSEEDSKLSGNVGVQIGTVEDCAKKSDDVSISGDGINLFVEVFGPLDGISEINSDLICDGKECSSVKSGNLAHEARNSISKNEGAKDVDEQECMFEVGDLVWVKARTPLWWPGMISDTSNDETEPGKRATFLVKYFGNKNFVWCNNSDLKPFIEYYEQLSRQKTPRSFYDAVDRALFEIGRRVKSKMTCPCFTKGKNEENLLLVEEKGKMDDVLSLARFEPVKLLTGIKQFACSSYPSSKIEVTVMRSRVSSFYRSIGRSNNNISGGREKSLRAKKKRNPSDYDDLASSDTKIVSSRGRKKTKSDEIVTMPRKNGLGKSSNGRHVISKEDNINASSSDLLAELCVTAGEHFYIERSKYSDSLKRFYSSFRMYAFLDVDIADKEGGAQRASKKIPSNENKQKEEGINMVKESGNPSSNLDYVKESVDGNNDAVAKKIPKKYKPRKKKEERVMMSAGLESKKNRHDFSCMINFQKAFTDVRKSTTHPRVIHDDPISRLPDLNQNSPIPVEHVAFIGPSKIPFMPLPEQKTEGLVSPQSIPHFDFSIVNYTDQCHNGESTSVESGLVAMNTGLTPFVQQSQQMGFFPVTEPKKRKRIGKTASESASMIPDLNGIALDMNLSERSPLLDRPEGKPRQKRASNREEDPGGSVVLKFASGSDLPSKDTLVATFSRYGLVKESEILVTNESTVQIAYERTSDARFAFRSLEKGHSLGESLVGFDLNCVPEKRIDKKMRKFSVGNIGPYKTPTGPVEKPDITAMKQNVEMMKSTLEKVGDKISPEMRVKLENEIKAFLDKIGSSSSF